jgi:hypothetical protein
MRIVVALVVCLVVPVKSWAFPIDLPDLPTQIDLKFLNSDLTFGTGGLQQTGDDLFSIIVNGRPPFFVDKASTFQVSSGPLVAQTTVADGFGNIIQSNYSYAGGRLQILFNLSGFRQTVTGTFTAPIVSLDVEVDEFPGGNVTATYVLGRGTFDAASARALEVSRRTTSGTIDAQLVLVDQMPNDSTTPIRMAREGFTSVTLRQVPEPATALLALVGAGGAWLRRRRSNQLNDRGDV